MTAFERFGPGAPAYVRGILEDMSDEAAFLFVRLRSAEDSGAPAAEIAALNQRLEVQLDALVHGGALAHEVCAEHASDRLRGPSAALVLAALEARAGG